jgi:hypothetical protein
MAKCIFIATSGSRGDVEPFIALGKALQDAGYDVVLSAPPDYRGWIASHGIAHHAAGDSATESLHKFAEAIENDRFFQSLATEEYKRKFLDLFASIAAGQRRRGLADLLDFAGKPHLPLRTPRHAHHRRPSSADLLDGGIRCPGAAALQLRPLFQPPVIVPSIS